MAHPVNPNNNRQNSIPYIQNMGFDDKYKLPAVVVVGEDVTGATDATRRIQVDANGKTLMGGGLELPTYDYVSMALSAGDTTETYTFKTGGSGGTTVATVAAVYTDSGRQTLTSLTKT